MTENRSVVFDAAGPSERLPDWARDGFVAIEWLREQGLWEQIVERLKIQREGGYVGIDAFQFLLYFFGAKLKVGLKEFSDLARDHRRQLAAVGGRKRFPTQASMSRILSDVEEEGVRDFGNWLLRQVPQIGEVLGHPSVLTRDALGEGWHIFDWDPTITVLRQRALPVFEGMPEARRRSEALAEPGYTGRKRGEVQFSRATLQHAGSGLWLGIEIAPGNGALREAYESALTQVVATCENFDLSRDRVILRSDGVGGNVPFITACDKAQIHYITRLAHYQLLQDPLVIEHLNRADWFEVPSSGSGPCRQATDLGRVVLEPAPTSHPKDGPPFAPIETRVVVSRFPLVGPGRGAGITIDNWRYELYGTDLTSDAWPEVEIVSGYYGRTGQENRFSQEDRELGLDRIFSYHLPGQQLATLIGLFVWNFLVCRGMDLSLPPPQLPEQKKNDRCALTEVPKLSEGAPTETSPITEGGDENSAPPSVVERESSTVTIEEPGAEADDHESLSTLGPEKNPKGASAAVATRQELIRMLDKADWKAILRQHDGWAWLPEKGGLICPAQALLPLVHIEQSKDRGIRTRFKSSFGTCDNCHLRSDCTSSLNPRYQKIVRLPLPSHIAETALVLWSSLIKARQEAKKDSKHPSRPAGQQGATWRRKLLEWQPPTQPSRTPIYEVAPPTLLPAHLRKLLGRTTGRLDIEVRVELQPQRPRLSPVLAWNVADRQRRRLSWAERLQWNELPEGSRVEIRCRCDESSRQRLAQMGVGLLDGANAA
jgi:hypothetical protein